MNKAAQTKTKTIVTLVDVVGALANDTLEDNVYLLDNNGADGSSGEGTGELKTRVEAGDTLIWTIMAIEPEAYAAIAEVIIDSDYCEPVKKTYQGTDIVYWTAQVKKTPTTLPYRLKLSVGNWGKDYLTSQTPALIGA